MNLELSESQFREIAQACEYLGRHLINQPNFKALLLEDWISPKLKQESANILLDIWKVWCCEYIGDKSNSGACVHNYDPMQMGTEKLIKILPDNPSGGT